MCTQQPTHHECWTHIGVQQEATSHSPVRPSGRARVGLGTQWSAAGGYVTLTCSTLWSCWGGVGYTAKCSRKLHHTHLFDPLVMLGLGWVCSGVQQEATSHSPVRPSGRARVGLGTQWSAAGGYVTLTCLTLSSRWGGERCGEEGGVLLTTSAKLRVFPSMEEKLCTLSSSSVSSYSRLLRVSGVLSPSGLL